MTNYLVREMEKPQGYFDHLLWVTASARGERTIHRKVSLPYSTTHWGIYEIYRRAMLIQADCDVHVLLPRDCGGILDIDNGIQWR